MVSLSNFVCDFFKISNIPTINCIAVNSKIVQLNDIFFALQGTTHDGHDFVKEAYENGAIFCVVERKISDIPESAQIVVPSVQQTINDFAKQFYAQYSFAIIGITGSVGKTSTKFLLHEILSKYEKCVASDKSYNTIIGLLLTINNINLNVKRIILELGISRMHDMNLLSEVASSYGSIITAIEPAHLEGLESVEMILQEKTKILNHTKKWCVLPYQEKFIDYMREKAGSLQILTFGEHEKADLQLMNFDYTQYSAQIRIFNKIHSIQLKHNSKTLLLNAMSALAAAIHMKLPIDDILKSICEILPMKARGNTYDVKINGKMCTLIDDSYNANPASMTEALIRLSHSKLHKVVILGEMCELGVDTKKYHHDIINLCFKFDMCLFIGKIWRIIAESYKINLNNLYFCEDVQVAYTLLQYLVDKNSCILVKGSAATQVSKIIKWLRFEKKLEVV